MFTWSPKYSVGFEEVDFQHQKFLKIADQVINLIGNEFNTKEVKEKASELYEYGKWHFATESSYIYNCEDDKFEDHKAEHEAILLKLKSFIEDTDKFDAAFGSELMIILKKWFLNHILVTDKKLYACIIEHNFEHIIIKDENL